MIISLALAGALKDALARVRAYIYLLPRESAILSGRLVIASTGQISAVRERDLAEVFESFMGELRKFSVSLDGDKTNVNSS